MQPYPQLSQTKLRLAAKYLKEIFAPIADSVSPSFQEANTETVFSTDKSTENILYVMYMIYALPFQVACHKSEYYPGPSVTVEAILSSFSGKN